MIIKVELNDHKRKDFVKVVGETLEVEPVYTGKGTNTYELGDFYIESDNSIVALRKGKKAEKKAQKLISELTEKGFTCTMAEQSTDEQILEEPKVVVDEVKNEEDLPFPEVAGTEEESPEVTDPEDQGQKLMETVSNNGDKSGILLTVEDFGDYELAKLRAIIDSKATILKKALGAVDLTVEKDGNNLHFPWFDRIVVAQDLWAYTELIRAMCEMAKRQTRVLAVERDIGNDKFVFRLFMVRLGMIGDHLLEARRIILRNLTGNGSYKNPEDAKKREELRKSERATQTQAVAQTEPVEQTDEAEPQEPSETTSELPEKESEGDANPKQYGD